MPCRFQKSRWVARLSQDCHSLSQHVKSIQISTYFANRDKFTCLNMARTASNKTKSTRALKNATQKHRKRCVGLATALVTGALAMHLYASLCKTPMHTSKLTGLAWVKELLAGHPRRFYETRRQRSSRSRSPRRPHTSDIPSRRPP